MKSSLRYWVSWAAIALSLAGSQVAAAADSAEQSAVEATISRQMDAFKRDDAAAAYAFASPGVKAIFPDAGTFMAMVRNKYAPVYRPKSVAFGESTTGAEGITQSVTIIDSEGEAWTALYTLAKDANGNWQITGCVLVKRPDTST